MPVVTIKLDHNTLTWNKSINTKHFAYDILRRIFYL
jgi:hypothetical protein